MIILANDAGFVGEILVSQTQEDYGNSTELQYFIDKYSPRLLLSCLGREKFDDLKTHLNANGTIKDDAPQYWKDFAEKAKDPIRYFVFYHYFTNLNSQQEIVPKNAVLSNVVSKSVEVWNEFVRYYQGNLSYGRIPTPNVYPTYNGGVFIDWVGCGTDIENTEPSLVDFVRETPQIAYLNSQLYPVKNRLGI